MQITAAPTAEAVASVTALEADMRAKAGPVCDIFDARYTAWKQTWQNPGGKNDEFLQLTSLGVKILPLVVVKLLQPSEIKVVDLYNAIEKDTDFKTHVPADIIMNNHERNEKFTGLSTGWRQHKERLLISSSTMLRLQCDEYRSLVNLGPSIVAQAMLAYYTDRGGRWDEMLCELLSGHLSGAPLVIVRAIHQRWIAWFESDKGDAEAPYKLVGDAARLELILRAAGGGTAYAELA